MFLHKLPAAAMAVVVIGMGQAFGQVIDPTLPAIGVNVGGWGANTFSSTPAEGIGHGLSDLVRAVGEAHRNVGRGAVDIEKARTAYIDNVKLWNETVLEHRRLGEQRREEQRAARRALRERLAAMAANAPPPPRLSTWAYNRSTGAVHWPEALQSPEFASEREALEDLLAHKAYTGDPRDALQVYYAANDLLAQLKTLVRVLPSFRYLEARKFLVLLAEEARAEAAAPHDMISAAPSGGKEIVAR